MSKSISASASLCLGLVRDAFGNGYVGDPERSLRYLELAAKGLELHIQLLNSRNDARVEANVREFRESMEEKLNAFPPLDMSNADTSMARFHAAGIKSILPSMGPLDVPGLRPEPGSKSQVLQLSGEDAKKLFMTMASSQRPAH